VRATAYIAVVLNKNSAVRSSASFIALFVLMLLAQICVGQINPQTYSGMRWRMIGPFRGGRAVAISGVAGQPDVYYFGAVAGGVWKTTNGGTTWQPIFDSQPIASIGAIAVAPSDPNIIYVGTGETDIRSDLAYGDGVYKSTDAGKTWSHLGLDATRHIGKIVVDPRNPNIVLVAALGNAYGPNPERGVFRSTDGGKTWTKVLYKDENTGAVDLALDPADSKIVFATTWNAHRPPWSVYGPIEGPGSGLYKSTDGGTTWKQITGAGLPGGQWGRVGVATARAGKSTRVYATIDAGKELALYRSDDGGATWKQMSKDPRITSRQWYFAQITVDPRNPDIVYIPDVSLYCSTDGGKTFEAYKGAPGGDDYHALWINPQDTRHMAVASDQGTVVSVDGGKSWTTWYNQPTAQMYHVVTDNEFPYHVYGSQQDIGSIAVASRGKYGEISERDWFPVGGGESGYIAVDPTDSNIIYAGGTYGGLSWFDRRTGQSQNIAPTPVNIWGTTMPERTLRFTWTSPIVFSPRDPKALYFGSQYVLKTTDQGMSWKQVSPDLTGAAANVSQVGPLTVENAKQRGWGVVYTIAPSPLDANLIWAGTDTGLIHVTHDGGQHWSNVTPSTVSDWSKISIIEASPFDPDTAYAAVDRHRLADFEPHILRTHDGGKTWQETVTGIPGLAYVHAVREDPERKGLLYAGTEMGVFVSFDDGDHWQALQLNLPVAPVHDLVVHGDDLVIATHGRSFWILDDVMPLRQISAEIAGERAHLFRPQRALRLRLVSSRQTPFPPEIPSAMNPPEGATIDYYLSSPAKQVTLEILDGNDKVVRHYSSPDKQTVVTTPQTFPSYWLKFAPPISASAGEHRMAWDLRYSRPNTISTSVEQFALYGRPTIEWPRGAFALPGNYQVRLTVDGQSQTQPLQVEPDPRISVPMADLEKQFATEMRITDALDQNFAAVQEIKALREQLAKTHTQQTKSLDESLAKLTSGSGEPGTPSLTELDQRLSALLSNVDSADAAPTSQALQTLDQLLGELNDQLAVWTRMKAEAAQISRPQ
jgi:photosystem II stability/assembly factor-like uncharacterized protein